MAKILSNTTNSSVSISDTGITISANSDYTIPSQDYMIWAASSDAVTKIGDGTLVVNDGSADLSISDGVDLIKGIFPTRMKVTDGTNDVDIIDDNGTKRMAVSASFALSSIKIKGDTDDTLIGNVGDSLKVTAKVNSKVSTDNSSSANLAASATFTGTWEDVTNYSDINVMTYITQNATLLIEFSTDGSTVHRALSYVIPASAGTPHKAARIAKYVRVKLTNNGASTATVALQTILSEQSKSHLTTNLSSTINDYSDAELVRAVLVGEDASGNYENISLGDNGGLSLDLTKAAFGALTVAQLSPYINISAVRGTPERFTETYSSGTGSLAGWVDNNPGREFKVSTGTSVGGYGVVRSKKVMSYRPGIGTVARFTARFTTPVANSIQRAGLFNIGNELTFGYDGTKFGILRRTGGRPEIRKLTLTQRATSSQTVTVTLNGVSYNVTATGTNNSGSIEENAYEIASGAVSAGWAAYNVGSTIIFQAQSIGAKNGTYSVSSTGNLAGTFSQVASGANAVDTWHYQEDWNHHTLLANSSDHSPFVLDPTKGNVFQVQYQYLGYGLLGFFIQNPETGRFLKVHDIHYANANTTPSLDIPEFKLGIIAASAGSTTNLSVYSGSMAGFHENISDFPIKIHSTFGSVGGIGTSLTNVIALKKISVSDGLLVITDSIMQSVTCASEATNPVVFEIRLNPTFSAPTLWSEMDEDTPVMVTSTGGTVTGGEVLYTIALSKSSNIFIDTKQLAMILSTDDVISIAARATNGTVSATASAVFGEA